jgi:thiol-disulfide isomerase/thioredoxin
MERESTNNGRVTSTPPGILAVQVHAFLTLAIAAPLVLGFGYLAHLESEVRWLGFAFWVGIWALPAVFTTIPRRSKPYEFLCWGTLVFGLPTPLFLSSAIGLVLFVSSGRQWFKEPQAAQSISTGHKVLLVVQGMVHFPIVLLLMLLVVFAVTPESISEEDFTADGVPQLVKVHDGEIETVPAPGRLDFTAIRLDDPTATFSLEELRGEPVVVMFYASWCGTCVRNWPRFSDSEFGGAKKVVVATDCMSDGESNEAAVEAMAREGGWTGPIYCSTYEIDEMMRLTYIPTTFVLDANGYPRARFQEVISNADLEGLDALIPTLDPIERPPAKPVLYGADLCVVDREMVPGVESKLQIGDKVVLGEDYVSVNSERSPLRWTGSFNNTFVARSSGGWIEGLNLTDEFYVSADTEPRLSFQLGTVLLASTADSRCMRPQ